MRPEPLPLRPLTVGELLDASVGLARSAAPVLLPFAFVLAVLEQLALTPLRLAYFGDASPLPAFEDLFGEPWLVIAIGAGTETLIIALLGGFAGRAAAHGTTHLRPSVGSLIRGSRMWLVVPVALLAGAITMVLTLVAPGWLIGYPLLGLVVPVLVIDRLGLFPSFWRGFRLGTRLAGRGASIRLLGYIAWFTARFGFGLGVLAATSFGQSFGLPEFGPIVVVAAFTLVNTIAYPALACLDAVLHVETRMRTEGLDIALARATSQGRLETTSLVVNR
ncbi:hypothetical protein F4553_003617 [Allocatelliglobosispora scoriae]|uniref:Glycerophosphoryl diester phosphodiesterase membrane domain-containing protein n=1 Tax=Allocatelliglobosispora scoriae TaxID=643052 RepID=A0A841BS62_9ACTN|nr:hypothetical protein [Allocatelliglobosispora scoriae]MBB5870238.1 hypothetical protein [Allocatelliglobosispora scoriae]